MGYRIRLQMRRDYKTAEKYLKRAIEISPNTSLFYVDLALIIIWIGKVIQNLPGRQLKILKMMNI